jgi:hypothetical protein
MSGSITPTSRIEASMERYSPRVVGGFHLTDRMDRRERQRDAVEVERRVDRLHVVWRARSARNSGMVSSFSARRRLM